MCVIVVRDVSEECFFVRKMIIVFESVIDQRRQIGEMRWIQDWAFPLRSLLLLSVIGFDIRSISTDFLEELVMLSLAPLSPNEVASARKFELFVG